MKATVTYRLSEDGQRAALAAGLPAVSEQTVQVDVAGEDLSLFRVASDGSLSANATEGVECYSTYRFDVPPTAVDILVFLHERVLRRTEAAAAKKAGEERKAAESEAAKAAARQSLLEAVRAASAAGLVYVKGYRVGFHDVTTDDYGQSVRVLDTEDPDVAAICERKRDVDAAASAKAARLKKLPDVPIDHPSHLTSDGTYAVDVPSGRHSDSWAKHVANVNPAQRGGYALEGNWLREKAALPAGAVVVVGSKTWSGSRRNGEWLYDVAVYVMTPANLCRVWRGDSTDQAVSKCRQILDQSETERVADALTRRIATCDKQLGALATIDRKEYAGELDELDARTAAWQTLRDQLQAALDGGAGDDRITDVDSAAAAIVASGYRALAQEHHPDHGGSPETMVLINEARRQLRELLKLAALGA